MEERRAIIEARNSENDWDSDYVGTESFTVDEARTYIAELRSDPDWHGWEFRIRGENEAGCYCVDLA